MPADLLFICDFNAHGGTQTHLLQLLERLDRGRFRPSLAALTLHPGLGERLSALDVETIDLGIRGGLRPATMRAGLRLAGRARRTADLLHGLLYQGNLLTAAVSLASGVPCLTSVRNLDLWKSPFQRFLSGAAHRRARRVIFNSQGVLEHVVEAERIPRDRTRCIPNGIDVSTDPVAPAADLADLAGRGTTIVCVASLSPKKGHRVLLDAFRRVLETVPAATLLLAGDGPLRERIRSRCREMGIGASVRLLGHRSDVRAVLAASDVMVLSSFEEGMPNALLEAMAAGLPCVATQVGGNGEVIAEGKTGYLVTAGDDVALADRIVGLIREPGHRRDMGDNGRKRLEARFGLDAMIASYERLYQELLG